MALSVLGKQEKAPKRKKANRKKPYQKKPLVVSDNEIERQIREYAKKKQMEKQRQNRESMKNE